MRKSGQYALTDYNLEKALLLTRSPISCSERGYFNFIFLPFFSEQSQYFFNTTSPWKFRFGEKIFQIRNILPDKSQFSHRWGGGGGYFFANPSPPSLHTHTFTHIQYRHPCFQRCSRKKRKKKTEGIHQRQRPESIRYSYGVIQNVYGVYHSVPSTIYLFGSILKRNIQLSTC